MKNYQIQSAGGIHNVTALTFTLDSLGLRFHDDQGQVVAHFTTFDWFRVVPAEVAVVPAEQGAE